MDIADIEEYERYALLNNTLLKFIENAKMSRSDLSMLDIIMDYSFYNNLTIDEIAESINSDEYFKDLFEKDCKSHLILKSEKKRLEEW